MHKRVLVVTLAEKEKQRERERHSIKVVSVFFREWEGERREWDKRGLSLTERVRKRQKIKGFCIFWREGGRGRECVCVHVSERERAKERDCWQWYITTFRVFKSEFLRFSSSLRRPTPQGTLLKRFCWMSNFKFYAFGTILSRSLKLTKMQICFKMVLLSKSYSVPGT